MVESGGPVRWLRTRKAANSVSYCYLGVFSGEDEKGTGDGEVSFGLQITLNDRARSYLAKMKNITLVDA
jgi:hypothetical protein